MWNGVLKHLLGVLDSEPLTSAGDGLRICSQIFGPATEYSVSELANRRELLVSGTYRPNTQELLLK